MPPTQTKFTGKLLLIGCGGVGRCTLPMLLQHLDMPRNRITVIDSIDRREFIREELAQGVVFIQDSINRDRMSEQLAGYVGSGDIIVDLAWNIACLDIVQWCHDHGVLYINTSVELWDPYENFEKLTATDRTLYVRHMAVREMIAQWKEPGPTAILEHGANPGLVSHFTKIALLDISRKIIRERPADPRVPRLENAVTQERFNVLAHLLGVRTIHISEQDSQIISRKRPANTFYNTWSVEGLYEEATSPAELGWGTHERWEPSDARHHETGPKNQICLERFGMDTFIRSRIPSCEIEGMLVRHGEAFTISDALTVWDERGNPLYRPTVHYAYKPCEAALDSAQELRQRNYILQDQWLVLADELESGIDELGVLLMGHDFKSWWSGTILSLDEARRLVPGQNATTVQVAAAVVAGVCWMIRNPDVGVKRPDDLPHQEIMKVAAPFLGRLVSEPLDWTPVSEEEFQNTYDGNPNCDALWQFERFLINREPPAKLPKLNLRGSTR